MTDHPQPHPAVAKRPGPALAHHTPPARARQSPPSPSPAALHQTEAQFQQAVIDLALTLGWLCYHTHDSRHSAKGFPDLTLLRGERLLFAELKSETGKVSPAQREWLEALATAGVEIRIWRPSDWPAIERELRRR